MGAKVSLTVFLVASLLAADSLQVVFDRAVSALAAQDYAAAEQGFQMVLKAKPNHIGALGNLGVVYSRTHRYAKAVEVYRRALRSGPNDQGLLLNLGLAYIQQEQYAKALPLFSRIVSANPHHQQGRELLATCELYTGRLRPAVERLESLRADEPQNPGLLYLLGVAYFRLNQPEKAAAALSELMTVASPAQANFLIGKANYANARFEAAAENFRKALETDPKFPSAHRELGKVYISLRRNEEAEAELKRALEADPADQEDHYYLGGLLFQEGRLQEAEAHLQTARSVNPDYWGPYYYLGRIRLQQKKPTEAVELLDRAVKLNPAESSVYYQLSRALKFSGKETESRKVLEKFKQLQADKLREEENAVRQ